RPLEGLALGRGQRLPPLVAGEDVRVRRAEAGRTDRAGDDVVDLLGARPDVVEVDRLAVRPGAQRLRRDVPIPPAGRRVRDHQRRRGQVVHLDVRVDPALEVAVAGEHADRGQVLRVDRRGDRLGQRSGVPDAGRAAVADQIETKLVQVRGETGPVVV